MLSSILKTSSSTTFHKTINAPPDHVLQVLHDPQILIKCNPLVSNFNQDPNDPSGYSYVVTDDLTISILGLPFKTTSRYRCTFAPREDGMDSVVSAGLGTKTSSHFTIKDIHDQGRDEEGERITTQLVYVAEVEAFRFFMSFIMNTINRTRDTILEGVASSCEGLRDTSGQKI